MSAADESVRYAHTLATWSDDWADEFVRVWAQQRGQGVPAAELPEAAALAGRCDCGEYLLDSGSGHLLCPHCDT